MNRQEIYDKVKNHLMTQQRRSTTANTKFCLYRNPNGLMCGIGPLITDEQYTEDLEGNSAYNLATRNERNEVTPALNLEIFNFENAEFLHQLQCIHDNHEPHTWGGVLMKFACDHDLNP